MESLDKTIEPIKFLKNTISNIDIFALAHELNDTLKEGFVDNIYEIPERELLIIKFRTKEGKRNVIIDPKKRINLTRFDYPIPPSPSQFIMGLRKYMNGRRIERIYQYKLDRILIVQLKSSEGNPWLFVIEFFGGGNYILINGEGLTHLAKSYKKLRDREILAKRKYDFPPSRGIDLFDLNFESILDAIKKGNGEIVRYVARSFNIGGYLAEEFCLRANIPKNQDLKEVNETQINEFSHKLDDFIQNLNNFKFSPRVLLDSNEQIIGFEPFELLNYSQYKYEIKSTFNDAVDEFFSKIDSEILFSTDLNKSNENLTKSEKILKKQIEKIEVSKEQRENALLQGELLFQHLHEIDNLINTIMTQKREKKMEWNEIAQKMEIGKQQKIPECLIFDQILPKELKLQIKIDDAVFKLDLKKSAIENAQIIYDQAKKAKRKIEGASVALETTKKNIEKQQAEFSVIEAQKAVLIKKPTQKWYEKYRWFISSDNFLIVGGRDASSNEIIVKKHMKKNDLFFHTDVHGASVCVIQNESNNPVPEKTINETAIFAASYSSAWKQGWSSADIYYVFPDQVSKTPKAGEYLSKGSFYITGKKNFLTKPYLELAIGVKMICVDEEKEIEKESEEAINDASISINLDMENQKERNFYPQIVSGPISAIKTHTNNWVVIKPTKSGLKASDLAKKIKQYLVKKSEDNMKKWTNLLSLNDLIRVIPPGFADVAEK